MNYIEEQNNELEALEAIYPNELTMISRKPFPKFSILVKSEQNCDENEEVLEPIYSTSLVFTLCDSYPDDLPQMEIQESLNLDDCDEQELLQLLESNAKESVGMVMIFTLATVAIEWINQLSDRKRSQRLHYLETKKKEEEELERKKFEGTRVTVESFMVWKLKFESEMAKLNKNHIKQDISKKLTGRQMFEINKSLIESDLQFLDDGVNDVDFDDVKVDESLFQDLDDLDIEAVEDR